MKLLKPSDYSTMKWKNGGGVTHEIAVSAGPREFVWRLSIAEVAESGEFSLFPDHHRILTVIEGNGINLISEKLTLTACKKDPTSFSGDQKIQGNLLNGPIRDFNLIYDHKTVNAKVYIVDAGKTMKLSVSNSHTIAAYAVSGTAFINATKVCQNETLIGKSRDVELSISSADWAIAVTIRKNGAS